MFVIYIRIVESILNTILSENYLVYVLGLSATIYVITNLNKELNYEHSIAHIILSNVVFLLLSEDELALVTCLILSCLIMLLHVSSLFVWYFTTGGPENASPPFREICLYPFSRHENDQELLDTHL